MLSGAEEVVFSQHELNSKNLSLYLRFYSTGKVRLGYYSNDQDTMKDWSKKERGIISPSAPITVKRHELSMWRGKSPKNDLRLRNIWCKKGDTIIGGWNRVDKGRGKASQVYMGAGDEV